MNDAAKALSILLSEYPTEAEAIAAAKASLENAIFACDEKLYEVGRASDIIKKTNTYYEDLS